MNQDELKICLDKLGLRVPKIERDELLAAFLHVEKMAASVRKPHLSLVEPAHAVVFPKDNRS